MKASINTCQTPRLEPKETTSVSLALRLTVKFGRRHRLAGVALCVFGAFATQVANAEENKRVESLLDEIDDLWRGGSSHTKMSMKVKTKHYTRSMRMESWSKGKDQLNSCQRLVW